MQNHWINRHKKKYGYSAIPDLRNAAWWKGLGKYPPEEWNGDATMLILAGVVYTNTKESMEIYHESLA